MYTVTYPDFYESFLRAFGEVLSMFINDSTEERFFLGNTEAIIQPALIDFTGRFLIQPQKNTITILFDQFENERQEHCVVGTGTNKTLGFEKRTNLILNVFVSVPIDSSTDPNKSNQRQAIRIHDNLNVIIDTQTKLFEERNIHALHLSSPIQSGPADQIAYVKSKLTCELRASYLKSGCQ